MSVWVNDFFSIIIHIYDCIMGFVTVLLNNVRSSKCSRSKNVDIINRNGNMEWYELLNFEFS